MKHKKNIKSGLTLAETMAAALITSALIAVVFQMNLSNKQHASVVDRSSELKELLTNNAIEIKAAHINDLPDVNNCLVRTYNAQFQFQSQSTLSGTGSMCGASNPSSGRVQVVWEIRPSQSIDVSFNNSMLKLPHHSSSLKKIIVHARGYAQGDSGRILHNQVTLFKR